MTEFNRRERTGRFLGSATRTGKALVPFWIVQTCLRGRPGAAADWATLWRLLLVLLCVAHGLSHQAAQAGDQIPERVFIDACEEIPLSEPQMLAAMRAFERYTAAVEAVEEEWSRIIKEGIAAIGIPSEPDERPPVERFRNPRITPEQHEARNTLYREASAWARLEKASLRRELLSEVESMLSDDQLGCLPWIERYLRIAAVTDSPRHPRAKVQDLVEQVNLRTVLKEAMKEGHELDGIILPRPCGASMESAIAPESLGDRIAKHLDTFEIELAHHFQRGGVQRKRLVEQMARASESGNEAEILRARRDQAALGYKGFALVRDALAKIAPLIRDELGDAAADAFEDRVNGSMFPVLYQRETPERMYQWLAVLDELSDDVRAAIDAIHDDYLRERRRLRTRVMHAMFEYLIQGGRPYPPPPPDSSLAPLHARLAEAQSARHALASRVNARFRGLLPPDDALRFDEHYKQVSRLQDMLSGEAPP